MSAFTNHPLQYVLFEVYEENVTSLRHVVQKGRNILIAFKDNCQYSFLIQYQKLTSGSF